MNLLLQHFARVAEAPEAIPRLRGLILDLAIRGKLVPHGDEDEPASELLKRIAAAKSQNGKPATLLLDPNRDISHSLPRNWAAVPLISLGSWAVGAGFPRSEQGKRDGEYLFLKVSDMNLPGNEKYIVASNNTIDSAAARRMRAAIHPPGTIIFPKIGGAIATNKRRILTRGSAIDNNCLGITLSDEIDIEWAYLLMTTLDFTKYQAGTAVPALQQGVLERIPIALPPLAEQHRIVAKVDELIGLCHRLEAARTEREMIRDRFTAASWSGLDSPDPVIFPGNARLALESFQTLTARPDQIKLLRQTVLDLAVHGRLVSQDSDDEAASKTLDRICSLKTALTNNGDQRREKLTPISEHDVPFPIPQNWSWVRVGLISIMTDYGTSVKSDDTKDGVPVLAMGDIQGGRVLLGTRKKVPRDIEDLPSLFLKRFDLLYNRTNSPELVGKTGIFTGDDDSYTFASYLIRLRFASDLLSPAYVNLAMNAPYFRTTQIMPQVKQQCGQANVNCTKLRNMLVPVPPLAEQYRIVAKVEELNSLCDELEASLRHQDRTTDTLLDVFLNEALAASGGANGAEELRSF